MTDVTYASGSGAIVYTPNGVRNLGFRGNQYTWLRRMEVDTLVMNSTRGGTEFISVDIPDDFYAVRVGFMNITNATYSVTSVKAIATAGAGYVTPVDSAGVARADSDWVSLTSVGAGLNVPEIVTVSGASTSHTILANATNASTGQTDDIAYTWTDWVACKSQPALPSGFRRLLIRALIPSSQTITYNVLPNDGWWGDASLNQGYDQWCGGIRNNVDYVTTPSNAAAETTTTLATPPTAGMACAVVQVLTKRPAVVGMSCGDSTMANATWAMSLLAATQAGHETVDTIPQGFASCADAGTYNAQFFPRLATLLPLVRPSYVILPGWTTNDFNVAGLSYAASEATFNARLARIAALCRANGAVPIFTTPWGYDTARTIPAMLAMWQSMRARTLTMANGGELVVDQFGEGGVGDIQTAAYYTGMSSDGLHPTEVANKRGARLLVPAIKRVAGL
jgi:hypothetical protein